MTTIHLTDIYGTEHDIEAEPGQKLMEVLREYDFGVAASCGGFCSCATCHVYIDAAWRERLPDKQSDEQDLLSMLSTYDPASSRLSCQVKLEEGTADLTVEIPRYTINHAREGH